MNDRQIGNKQKCQTQNGDQCEHQEENSAKQWKGFCFHSAKRYPIPHEVNIYIGVFASGSILILSLLMCAVTVCSYPWKANPHTISNSSFRLNGLPGLLASRYNRSNSFNVKSSLSPF